MLYRIKGATAHSDRTITMVWSDDVTATVDLDPVIRKGNVFASMQDSEFFVSGMSIADDRLGVAWPGGVDFSADGLRFRAFPEEAADEFEAVMTPMAASAV